MANSRWTVTPKNGFLPTPGVWSSQDTAVGIWLAAVEELAGTQNSIDQTSYSAALDTLPASSFELQELSNSQQERGYAALTFLAARHLTSLSSSSKEVPLALSLPLLSLADQLHRKPTLTYSSYVLSNWIGKQCPYAVNPDQVEVALTFTDTETEWWFIAVHIAIESLAPKAIEAGIVIENGLETGDYNSVQLGLMTLNEVIRTANSILPRMLDRLDTNVFRVAIRPFLFGFSDVRFAGCDERHSYLGESGAQSGMLRYIDALVKPTSRSTSMQRSIDAFISYAPLEHQLAIQHASQIGQSLRAAQARTPAIADALQNVRLSLSEFRTIHLRIVSTVIQPSDGPKGTGGTTYHPWLAQLAAEVNPDSTS